VQNKGQHSNLLGTMRQANPKRRSMLRLRAVVLLACLLSGPLRMIAAPWFHSGDDCCTAGMCKTHKHAQAERKAESACEHEKNKSSTDCVMQCGEPRKDSGVLLRGVPETILASAITITAPRESRAEMTLALRMFENQVLTPPDQPPRP